MLSYFTNQVQIAEYLKSVDAFATHRGVANFVVGWAFVGTIPILFSTGVIAQHTAGSAGLTHPSFIGWEVPEWLFMLVVWFIFNLGKVFLSISEEYYRLCETAASNLALEIARNLSYVLMIYYSLSRCWEYHFLRTENNHESQSGTHTAAGQTTDSLNTNNTAPRNEDNQGPQPETHTAASETTHSLNANNAVPRNEDRGKSWSTVIADKQGNFFVRVFVFGFIHFSSTGLLIAFFIEMFGIVTLKDAIQDGPSICSIPSVGPWTRALGIAQFTFEPIIYAIHFKRPPSKNRIAAFFRYFVRVLIFGFYSFLISANINERYLVWRVPL